MSPGIACRDDTGSALLITLLIAGLIGALSVALVLLTMTETMISANHRRATELLYAADAGLDLGAHELARQPDWDLVLSGVVSSSYADRGGGTLADGSPIALTGWTTRLQAETDAEYDSSPNRPVWLLFAYLPLDRLVPGDLPPTLAYLVVWVGDDAAETDGNPALDSNGLVLLRAASFGPFGSGREIEAVMSRVETAAPAEEGPPTVTYTRLGGWREIR
jgi:hypothetical protein